MSKHTKYGAIVFSLCLIALYLWLSYSFIYFRIGAALLPSADNLYSYTFNENLREEIINYSVLGDSLTSGVGVTNYKQAYPYLVAEKLSNEGKSVNLKNFSYPGARTDNIIEDLLDSAIESQPKILTLLIGTNDMHGLVSLSHFENNYRIILEQLRTRTNAEIYTISVPFLCSKRLFLPPYNYYFQHRTSAYNKIIKGLSEEYDLHYIDIASESLRDSKSNSYYAADLFHPNNIVYAQWANIIYANFNR